MVFFLLVHVYAVRRFSPKKFVKPLFTFVYGTNRILTRVSGFPVGFLVYPLFPAVFHRLGQCLLVKFPLPGQFPELFSWSFSVWARQDMAVVEVPRLGKDAAAKAIRSKAIKDWGQPKSKTTHDVFCIFAPGRWSPVVVSDRRRKGLSKAGVLYTSNASHSHFPCSGTFLPTSNSSDNACS